MAQPENAWGPPSSLNCCTRWCTPGHCHKRDPVFRAPATAARTGSKPNGHVQRQSRRPGARASQPHAKRRDTLIAGMTARAARSKRTARTCKPAPRLPTRDGRADPPRFPPQVDQRPAIEQSAAWATSPCHRRRRSARRSTPESIPVPRANLTAKKGPSGARSPALLGNQRQRRAQPPNSPTLRDGPAPRRRLGASRWQPPAASVEASPD